MSRKLIQGWFQRLVLVVLAQFAGPIISGDSAVAQAQTKTCGTPGGPTCPGPAPVPSPLSFKSLTSQAWGKGPFDSVGEAWSFTADVDQPNSNHCSPTNVNISQPGYSWGTTPAYMYSPNVLLAKDSWSVSFTARGPANPGPYETPCEWESNGGDEIVATKTWVCPNDSGIYYTSSPQLGPNCPVASPTPDDPPPPKAPGGDCGSVGPGNSGGAGPGSSTTPLGNPCDISNGNKHQVETDYTGVNGLKFTRSYNSLVAYRHYANWNGMKLRTPLGVAWTATFLQSLVEVPTTDSTGAHSTIHAFRPDGRILTFVKYSGVYVPDADTADQVTMSGGGFTYRTASDTVETYDTQGRLTSVTPRGGVTLTVSYASSDAVVPSTVSDPFGHTLTFGYLYDATSGGFRIMSLTDPAGGVTSYAYDANKNLASVTFPDTRTRSYGYAASGNQWSLTSLTDESSTVFANWSYSAGDGLRVLSSSHAGGVDSYTFAYPAGSPRTVTDPLGTVRTYSQQTVQGVTRTSGISSSCAGCIGDASRTFDANANVSSRTDFNGNVTNYVYDQDRNLETSRTEAHGTPRARTITTSWHSTFRLPSSITELNRTTSFTYDSAGNVLTRTVTDTAVTPNVSRTWTFTYNTHGKVLTEDGPRTDVSDVTTYSYYSCTTGAECGQVNTVTNAAGHVTSFDAYNDHGQPTQITDANGLVTSLSYDARQRLTDRCVGATVPTCAGGELTHLDYWSTGLLKKVTNPDASYIEYTYDAAHRLTEVEDGANNKIVYTLDAMGNRTAENSYDPSSALKRTHTRVFNSLNQLWKDVNAAGTVNVTTVFGYDSNGNQTTVSAPLSRNSTNAYDELDRLNQITDPASGVTQFGYDANNNLTSVTDPRTLVTSYTYTGFGDLKAQVSPDTGTTTNTYDSGGNLATSTDARGAVTTYGYDALNRQTSTAYTLSGATDQTIAYTYDTGTNQKGRLKTASDANHTLAWSYDSHGRVVGKGQTVSGVTLSIGYGYNAAGQFASLVLPSGQTIQYGYNANGQVASVTLLGTPNVTILSNVAYDPFGPITGWTWGNSSTFSRAFDSDGKLTGITNSPTTIGDRTFGYDDAFRITSTADSASGGPSWTLGYDSLDRLNSATKTGMTIGYTYDANGNRLSQTGTSASTYSVSGSSNRRNSTTGALTRSYSFDSAGNVLSSGATVHSFNNANRMKTGRLAGGSDTSYIYNALGQRVKKSGGAIASPVYYFYDEAGHLVGEYDSSGALIQETVWLGDIPVATLRAKTGGVDEFYVHADQLNTPRKVSVSTGADANKLRWKWDPTPFGQNAPDENPTSLGGFAYNLRFPGQVFDVETNLNYNYFRDYDPAVGGYIQSDPTGLRDGVNTYVYVHGRPTIEIDPLGLGRGASAPPARSTGEVAVSVRCGGLFGLNSWNHGGYGVHCEVVATCKKTGETIGFGIGGPPGLSNQISSGDKPGPYDQPRTPKPPDDIAQYEATCGKDSECDGCSALECFKRMHAGNKPPPYYALSQNSNTYAHLLLNQCGCNISGMRGPPGAQAW